MKERREKGMRGKLENRSVGKRRKGKRSEKWEGEKRKLRERENGNETDKGKEKKLR